MSFTGLDQESNQAINDAIARRANGAAPTPVLDQNTQSPTAVAPVASPITGAASPSGMPQGMKKPLTENESNRKIILGAMKGELERIGKSEEMAQNVPMA